MAEAISSAKVMLKLVGMRDGSDTDPRMTDSILHEFMICVIYQSPISLNQAPRIVCTYTW